MVEYYIFVEDGYVLTKVNFTFWGRIKAIFFLVGYLELCVFSHEPHTLNELK